MHVHIYMYTYTHMYTICTNPGNYVFHNNSRQSEQHNIRKPDNHTLLNSDNQNIREPFRKLANQPNKNNHKEIQNIGTYEHQKKTRKSESRKVRK